MYNIKLVLLIEAGEEGTRSFADLQVDVELSFIPRVGDFVLVGSYNEDVDDIIRDYVFSEIGFRVQRVFALPEGDHEYDAILFEQRDLTKENIMTAAYEVSRCMESGWTYSMGEWNHDKAENVVRDAVEKAGQNMSKW